MNYQSYKTTLRNIEHHHEKEKRNINANIKHYWLQKITKQNVLKDYPGIGKQECDELVAKRIERSMKPHKKTPYEEMKTPAKPKSKKTRKQLINSNSRFRKESS